MDFRQKYHGNVKWIQMLFELLDRYFQHEIGKSAAALTYYMVFTFFPFLIFLSMLLGFLNIPLVQLGGDLGSFLPEDIIVLINLYITHITETRNSALLVFGLLFTVWFSMRAVSAMMAMVNLAYEGTKPKSFVRHRLSIFLFTICMMIFILIAIVVLVLGKSALEWVAQFIPISIDFIQTWSKLRFLPLMTILFFILSALYYVAPSYQPQWNYVFGGVIVALATWTVFSMGFAYYVDNMARYSMMYGSIGAIIVFLMWLYFSCVAILLGAEFNHARMMVYET